MPSSFPLDLPDRLALRPRRGRLGLPDRLLRHYQSPRLVLLDRWGRLAPPLRSPPSDLSFPLNLPDRLLRHYQLPRLVLYRQLLQSIRLLQYLR